MIWKRILFSAAASLRNRYVVNKSFFRMLRQTTGTVLMIRPINFRMNEQTAVNNYYQKVLKNVTPETVNQQAQKEFDVYVENLRQVGVDVIVVEDVKENGDTPDSIFPNNWLSLHENGTVCLYPMFAENRRLERRPDILERLKSCGFTINNVVDYTTAEKENKFLEGTGNLILDRANGKAYCALSPRADESLFRKFCEDFEYTPIVFSANQTANGRRLAIYHTNVMMCIGDTFAIICLECIDDKKERENVVKHLSDKEIIDVTEEQVNNFAGNMLQVKGKDGASYIVMSQAAYDSLGTTQITALERHGTILSSPLDVIEARGGGSARCMIAEIFLPKI